jgi:hypothetical protein
MTAQRQAAQGDLRFARSGNDTVTTHTEVDMWARSSPKQQVSVSKADPAAR